MKILLNDDERQSEKERMIYLESEKKVRIE